MLVNALRDTCKPVNFCDCACRTKYAEFERKIVPRIAVCSHKLACKLRPRAKSLAAFSTAITLSIKFPRGTTTQVAFSGCELFAFCSPTILMTACACVLISVSHLPPHMYPPEVVGITHPIWQWDIHSAALFAGGKIGSCVEADGGRCRLILKAHRCSIPLHTPNLSMWAQNHGLAISGGRQTSVTDQQVLNARYCTADNPDNPDKPDNPDNLRQRLRSNVFVKAIQIKFINS